MRLRMLDGGREQPALPADPLGVISEEWIVARSAAMDAYDELDTDAPPEAVEALLRRGQVCADTLITMGLIEGDSKRAQTLIHQGLLEAVIEVFSSFVVATRGTMAIDGLGGSYLRALGALANLHAIRGQVDRAMRYWRMLLDLDSSDAMFVRGWHYGACLLSGELEEAEAIWTRWRGDSEPALIWGRPLQFWLRNQMDRADAAVAVARQLLPDQEAILRRREPVADPDMAQLWMSLGAAWQAQPKALAWLAARPVREPGPQDFDQSGFPHPVPGVDPYLVAHLTPKDLARLAKVTKGILDYGQRHPQPELIDAALALANELAESSDAIYELAIKSVSAAVIYLAADEIGIDLDDDALCEHFHVAAGRFREAIIRLQPIDLGDDDLFLG